MKTYKGEEIRKMIEDKRKTYKMKWESEKKTTRMKEWYKIFLKLLAGYNSSL